MVISTTGCKKTSTPKAPNQQEFTAFPKCIRIVNPTLRRHFAPSYLLQEHTITTWPSTYVVFKHLTFQLITVPLTLLLLYRTANLYLCLVSLWFLLMLKVSLITYHLRSVLTQRSITFPRVIPTLSLLTIGSYVSVKLLVFFLEGFVC